MAGLPDLTMQIVSHARDHRRVTMGEMHRGTGANRNTLKEHFRRLAEQGHLVRHGVGKGSWYVVPCGRGRFRSVDVAAVAGAGDLTPDAKGAKITAATKSSVTTLPPQNES